MTGVYLEEITIKGYRSCEGTTFRPNGSLSGLIGINGAGKTNVLTAIHLLNPELYGRFYKTADMESPSRETVLLATFSLDRKRVRLRLTLRLSTMRGSEEVVTAKEEWNLADITGTKTWFEFPSFFLLGKDRHTDIQRHLFLTTSAERRVRGRRESDVLDTILSNVEARTAIESVVSFRRRIKYYSASQFTNPTRCPSSFEIDGEGKLENGYYSKTPSHLQFLFDLYSLKMKDDELYREFETFVSTKMLGLVSRLSWKPVKLSSNTVEVKSGGSIKKVRQYKTLVIPKVQIGSSHITFNQLSEGTFKTLALIFYLMTDRGSCLLIEEPEVCIHHGLLRRILSTIKTYSRRRQVVFSTHSDLVLDMMDINEVFVVDMKKSVTRVSSLNEWAGRAGMEALSAYMNEAGTLGEYWRSGGLSS